MSEDEQGINENKTSKTSKLDVSPLNVVMTSDIPDKKVEPTTWQKTEMHPLLQTWRKNLLEAFPKEKVEGLNLQRVEAFIKDLGLEVKSYIIVNPEDRERMKYIVGGSVLSGPRNSLTALGEYSPLLDLCVVVRNPELEAINGPFLYESVLAHELAHASAQHAQSYLEKPKNVNNVLRSGTVLVEKEWGHFIEEGFAGMIQGKYNELYQPQELRDKISTILGMEPFKPNDTIGNSPPTLGLLLFPAKYLYLEPDKSRLGYTHSTFNAKAMELLCEKNPRLFKALIEGRNSIEGLRMIAKELNTIKPGLYLQLQKNSPSGTAVDSTDYINKFNYIVDEIFGGIGNIVQASGILRKWWDRELSQLSPTTKPKAA